MSVSKILTKEKTLCYHCGEECEAERIFFDDKHFCCTGCKLVYDILKENNLCSYYDFNATPGTSRKNAVHKEQFAFLDDEKIKNKLVQFTDRKITKISFYIPQIHCSSCIWLLENLHRVNAGVIDSKVNFARKEASLTFSENQISLKQVVEMLSTIGYEPLLNLDQTSDLKKKKKDKSVIYKIGIAGFCFGNIMLFSFPEYFSSGIYSEHNFRGLFNYLNLAISLPVFFYCSRQFFQSAFLSLKQRFLNIDVPIALGILVMFLRSAYEILSNTGTGYMDTMAGLVFFMLVGRAFQNKTYETISFERDYKSFFPISVMIRKNGIETSIPVSDLKIGDHIFIRNEELIPADSVLMKGDAGIDYSFVTGESMPETKAKGDLIYAGGKQKGTVIELEVVRNVSQSYLTQLWNSDAYKEKKTEGNFQQLVNKISHYFTIILIAIAVGSLGYWLLQHDSAKGWNAFTAVLIIACPCALAISSPFTLGNMLRIFGRNKFYLKDYSVIEKLAKVDTVVFDKTGTLTSTDSATVSFLGEELTNDVKKMIRSLTYHSSHPLSKAIADSLKDIEVARVGGFSEIKGRGISGSVFDVNVKIGSWQFVCENESSFTKEKSTKNIQSNVYVSVDGVVKGYFSIHNTYRKGVNEIVNRLRQSGYKMAVISGDDEGEKENLKKIFGEKAEIYFNVSPSGKLQFIQQLQKDNKNVLMIGDGLNDAGALKQSDVGITVSESINNFSPSCDGILDASRFQYLTKILKASKASHRIILASFVIALLYNFTGLSFAVTGNLSPVFAAILMPLSAVTIISFTTGLSNWMAKGRLSHHSSQSI